MKKSLNDLAVFASTLSKKKFIKLSSKKQHELLAAMAYNCFFNNSYDIGSQRSMKVSSPHLNHLVGFHIKKYNDFFDRYNELHKWAALDRYEPPSWLSQEESLKEFYFFHNSFCPEPVKPDDLETKTSAGLSWEPVFEVSVMLDQIRSPFNAGSVLRIIDNFGFKELIHSTSTMSFDHPRLKKSARGCERWIPVRYEENPVLFLKNSKLPVIGIEKTDDAIDIANWSPPEKCILIAGNEEYGISESILRCCTQKIQIPMFGFKKSMNVHHALSVVAQKIVEKNVITNEIANSLRG